LARDRFPGIVPTPEATSLPSLVFELLADLGLMVSYQLEKVPVDAEWDAYIAALTGANAPRCIVITEGGYPSQAQRERLSVATHGKMTKVAVISPATTVRFGVSVLALVNRQIKSFSPNEFRAAFFHVGLAPMQCASVDAAVERLRQKLKSTRLALAGRLHSALANGR
jgi:polysaccharide pyruvyl transferase WcaK-like protein